MHYCLPVNPRELLISVSLRFAQLISTRLNLPVCVSSSGYLRKLSIQMMVFFLIAGPGLSFSSLLSTGVSLRTRPAKLSLHPPSHLSSLVRPATWVRTRCADCRESHEVRVCGRAIGCRLLRRHLTRERRVPRAPTRDRRVKGVRVWTWMCYFFNKHQRQP